MKRFKEYIKQLKEDKVITKEDEGAAAPIGDVSAPSGDTPSGGEVVTDTPKTDGGLTTADVLGKCDHKHDGFFGPGCFHRPYPIFSYPVSRIKKKKRKYIKVLDLTESDEYTKFYPLAKALIEKLIDEANIYLQKIKSKCFYTDDYVFSGDKANWVATIDYTHQEDPNTFGIAINLPIIYGFLEENSLENDQIELECQLKATIYHEIGHYIIKKFKNDEIYDFELSDDEEEKIVDEFTRYIMCEYTGQTSSKLIDFIEEIFGENISKDQLDETNMVIRGKFFDAPINMKDPQRKVTRNRPNVNVFGKIIPKYKNVLVPASDKIFSDQTNDYLVSLTNTGYMSIKPQIKSNTNLLDSFDDLTKQFLNFSDDLKQMCLQVIKSPKDTNYNRMSENGTFPEELETIWLSVMDMTTEERNSLIEKFTNAKNQIDAQKQQELKDKEIIYFRPTVADIVRIYHKREGIDTLPLNLLVYVDEMENKEDYRYNEDEEENRTTNIVSESLIEALTTKELCDLVWNRDQLTQKFSEGRPNRWTAMQKQLGNELQNYEKLGNIVYIIKYEGKERDIKYSYICDAEATLIGVTPKWDNVRREMGWYCTTFFYTTPSDIIYQLKRGKYKVDHGQLIYPDNVDNVSIDLLYKAVENVAKNKAFLDSDRGTKEGREKYD